MRCAGARYDTAGRSVIRMVPGRSNELFLDITELVGNPLRTGIQRVEREIIRYWPGPQRLAPCHFDAARQEFVRLPEAVFGILGSDAAAPGADEHELLRPHLSEGAALSPGALSAGLFNPEVFFDAARAAAYRRICRQPGARVSWLLFDFLPYLRPQDYPPGTARSCMHYIRALREIPRVSSISELTQIEYTTRIMRDETRSGPHFPLGGDGPQIEKQHFRPDKTSFAYIGTIEPRKNVAVILEAFEQLWASGVTAELIVIGRLDSRSTREQPMLERLRGEPRFRYLGHVDDATVRAVMQQVRATLFVSAVEGFGIPPYESLAAGVPVIVSPKLPSTDLLAPGGRITIPEITPQAVAAAVKDLLDDEKAARLWREASGLVIPTWRRFVSDLAVWVQSA
ncbi:MAG: glycosyltransferase family 4 protein [Alphaproteobacteria bacterium]|nr:MAG: glycosyltransferase family 4 protein [Alphaproteobacteria bacterium]